MSQDPEPNAIQITHPHPNITLITLSRLHRRNAVNAPTADKLYAAFQDFENDPDQKIAILTGENGHQQPAFCAGYDLHTVKPSNSVPSTSPKTGQTLNSLGPMGPSRMLLSKPLIAAISGPAVAGGFELSLLADMRVIASNAFFGVFCRRWGVPLIDGGTVRLQRLIGLSRALDLTLTGRPVYAEEAMQIGLANRLAPEGTDVVEEAIKLAESLLKFPQLCMNLDRKSAYFAAYDAGSLDEALKYEYENGIEAVRAEGAAGAKRFSEGSGRHGNFKL
ncbi:hypothetical protein CKM354_000124100 [Cercospora kikuchii]|uniref:Enoyl-CoA hydratase n=1 Tax=Cercospora kikuchii TaxID=84275 RepID=A0A9P3CAJ3_9PEZI|nr:uncharacterized protein CKM354_000124100 [Cercospora kikuchii]GIZ37807.1 hypothetical protein CKM354_000124100 [Cercospora kikuchii]